MLLVSRFLRTLTSMVRARSDNGAHGKSRRCIEWVGTGRREGGEEAIERTRWGALPAAASAWQPAPRSLTPRLVPPTRLISPLHPIPPRYPPSLTRTLTLTLTLTLTRSDRPPLSWHDRPSRSMRICAPYSSRLNSPPRPASSNSRSRTSQMNVA